MKFLTSSCKMAHAYAFCRLQYAHRGHVQIIYPLFHSLNPLSHYFYIESNQSTKTIDLFSEFSTNDLLLDFVDTADIRLFPQHLVSLNLFEAILMRRVSINFPYCLVHCLRLQPHCHQKLVHCPNLLSSCVYSKERKSN